MVFAGTDKGLFEEASALMFSNRPKLAPDFYEKQIDSNEKQDYSDKDVSYVLSHVPVWDKYTLVQDSAYHYKIEKSTGESFCRLKCREGSKAAGFFAVTGRDGGVVLGIRDMWQKHPSYDTVRHTWRYDMGGYAWQNTELAPTYLLWYSFLRSGSGEVFNYAEAMSRHCSEVDMYHLGYRRGIGTRHNVRHWGCSCKEPRISMAGHYRFYYYLTGDYRMGEVLTDSRDAEQSMKKLVTSDVRISESDGKEKLSIRSGPDWTSFVANWMTEYERTGDRSYLDKIQNGIGDVFQMPFGLASGPEYLLELESGHLEYTGEHEDSINMHLQVCQGGTQIWLELLGVLACTEGGDNKLRKLLADYGNFYMLTKEEKEKATDGKIVKRPFSFPYFASALASFSAYETGNNDLSKLVIEKILCALYNENDIGGFDAISYGSMDNGMDLMEIPWISTNFTSQWGLNMIVILEFLREFFPKKDSEMKKLLKGAAKENFHLA